MDLMDLPMWKKLVDASTILISLEQIWIIAKACLPMEWNTGRHLVRVSPFFSIVKASLKIFTLHYEKKWSWFRKCWNESKVFRFELEFLFYILEKFHRS